MPASYAAPKRAYRAHSYRALQARPVLIRGFTFDHKRHTVVLAATGMVTISTRTVPSPTRLVVDMARARLVSSNRELLVDDPLVKRVRIAQFSLSPPTVRLVVEPRDDIEPTLAVQQTGRRVYVTVAPGFPETEGELDVSPENSFAPPVLPIHPSRVQVTPIERPSVLETVPQGTGDEGARIQHRLRPPETHERPANINGEDADGWREVLPPLQPQVSSAPWQPNTSELLQPELRPEPSTSQEPKTPGVPVIPPGFERGKPPAAPALPGSTPEGRTQESGSETVPASP